MTVVDGWGLTLKGPAKTRSPRAQGPLQQGVRLAHSVPLQRHIPVPARPSRRMSATSPGPLHQAPAERTALAAKDSWAAAPICLLRSSLILLLTDLYLVAAVPIS